MKFYFSIPCLECNGLGEFEPFDPGKPIVKCDCEEGNIYLTETFDCEEDLKRDYPDAYIESVRDD
mgnify:FL=1|tara:strand:- start:2114 stop:2308 length:195 start_codon:yes stop_codon:yes gene_type:complete